MPLQYQGFFFHCENICFMKIRKKKSYTKTPEGTYITSVEGYNVFHTLCTCSSSTLLGPFGMRLPILLVRSLILFFLLNLRWVYDLNLFGLI